MIKKLKENFLILLISNMLTIIMIVVAPRIYGAIANLMMTVSDSDSGFSLPMIFYYISFAIIVCAFMCLRKPQAVRDIVINNSISSTNHPSRMWRKQKKCVNAIAIGSIVLKVQNMMQSKTTLTLYFRHI